MRKVLIIDDDEELCDELGETLRDEGFEVDVAFDGVQGKAMIDKGGYGVIILDLKLPSLNGYEVLKGIRGQQRPVKVLVLSGRPTGNTLLKQQGVASQDEEEQVLAMADAVMDKPFIVDDLVGKVKSLCSGK